MSRTDRPVGEDDLQAYVDGRLDRERLDLVERYLVDHPTLAGDLAKDREMAGQLRSKLAFKAAEPIPSRLRIANIRDIRRRRFGRRLVTVAAVACWLIVGGTAGWLGSDLMRSQNRSAVPGVRIAAMADAAIQAHRTFVVEIVHPVEVRASEEGHLMGWLSKRLGMKLSAPDLTSLGYRLMGGRLLPGGTGPAAMLMYDDDKGMRLTLYVKGDETSQTAFQFVEEDGFSALFWRDAGSGYVVTADMARQDLMRVAVAIYDQIDPNAVHDDGRGHATASPQNL